MEYELYMHRCLQLATLGAGKVAPNPMVGAVLVHEEKIIGEGFHMVFGGPHAEVNCIENVLPKDKEFIPLATLFVSLEPCNHAGKTPPCTEFIINHGIKHVVVACKDDFEKVNGSGVARLKEAGIKVTEGILEKEAQDLNNRFFTFHKNQRPYIILKWAQSSNGFIAGKDERIKISNEITDRLVHKWRSEEASILVGYNTARIDNPQLTTRHYPGPDPLRIVLDKNLSLPAGNNLLDGSVPTIIVNTVKNEQDGLTLYYQASENENPVAVVISLLHQRNIISIIVEGGAKTLQAFIDENIWDEARVIVSKNVSISSGVRAPLLTQALLLSSERILDDEILYFKNNYHTS